MSELETTEVKAPMRGETLDPDFIAYDYYKTLTSLSVLTLGGVLTLSETVFGARISPTQMAVAAGLVAASGVVALQCLTDMVQVAKGHKTSSRWLRYGPRLVPMLFGTGIGAFLVILAESFFS